MAQLDFNIRMTPGEAYNMLKDFNNAELIYDELKSPVKGKYIAIMVFEKYYFRSENRASLTVIIDNFRDITSVTAIASGSSKGLFFSFDWGAGDDFVDSVKEYFEDYIIE